MAKAKCKIKAYHIYVSNKFVCNSFGDNAVQAISFYSKMNGIRTGRACKVGICGSPYSMCKKNRNGVYRCTRGTKCDGVTRVESDVGVISAELFM